jgi:MFS family permease
MIASPLAFLKTASPIERRALLASTLGWMPDAMDVTLYSTVIRQLMLEFHLTAAQVGLLASATLVASAMGGITFGFAADRVGRRAALTGRAGPTIASKRLP